MTSARGAVVNDHPFSVVAWLLWVAIPTPHPYFLEAFNSLIQRSGHGPSVVMSAIMLGVVFEIAAFLVIATAQWLVLRRAWRGLFWPAWFGVTVVSELARYAAIIVLAVALGSGGTMSPFARISIWLIAFTATGLVAAAALTCKRYSRSAFAVLFAFFFGAAAAIPLIWYFGVTYRDVLTDAVSSISFHLLGYRVFFNDLFINVGSVACGAAISGFGLWLVSRWFGGPRVPVGPVSGLNQSSEASSVAKLTLSQMGNVHRTRECSIMAITESLDGPLVRRFPHRTRLGWSALGAVAPPGLAR
jgi:hypothetical protein